MLRCNVATANIDSVEFVGAYAAMKQFLAADLGIEVPLVAPLHQRHREWPVLVSNEEERPVSLFWVHGNALLFVSFRCEISGPLTVLRVFTGENDIVTIGPENLLQGFNVKFPGRVDKFISCLLGSVEHLCAHASGCRHRFSGGLLPCNDCV